MSASEQAKAAVRAAKFRKQWGEFATLRFMARNGVPANMAQIAIEFEMRRKS